MCHQLLSRWLSLFSRCLGSVIYSSVWLQINWLGWPTLEEFTKTSHVQNSSQQQYLYITSFHVLILLPSFMISQPFRHILAFLSQNKVPSSLQISAVICRSQNYAMNFLWSYPIWHKDQRSESCRIQLNVFIGYIQIWLKKYLWCELETILALLRNMLY